jgi:hypothetical protein
LQLTAGLTVFKRIRRMAIKSGFDLECGSGLLEVARNSRHLTLKPFERKVAATLLNTGLYNSIRFHFNASPIRVQNPPCL